MGHEFLTGCVSPAFQAAWIISLLYKHRSCTYSVSRKNPPRGLLAIFPKRLGIFQLNFTSLLCVLIYARLRIFIQLTATLTKLYHIKRDHPVHIMCAWYPPSAETHAGFSDILSKQLGIFRPNFTRILNVHMYARGQIFIQLSPRLGLGSGNYDEVVPYLVRQPSVRFGRWTFWENCGGRANYGITS